MSHIVHPSLLFCQEDGCIDGTDCKNILGVCHMIDFDDLILTCEDDLMLTDNGAAADGVDADFLLLTLDAFLAAVEGVVVFVVQGFVDGSAM